MNTLDIKKERENLNMTQEEFAELLGVSRKTIANYESGSNIPETKEKIFSRILSNFTHKNNVSDSFQKELEELNQDLEQFKVHTQEELIELSFKFLANKDEIYKLGIVKEDEETKFWMRYYDIVKKHGSMDNFLNKKI